VSDINDVRISPAILIIIWCFWDSPWNWPCNTAHVKWKSRRQPRSVAVAPWQTISVAFSPLANYTDWSTATCLRNLVPTFTDRGLSRGQRGGSPTAVNFSFLDRSR
jgi:hypothetical protein